MLASALASIGAQTHRAIEVILVNDGGQALDLELLQKILGALPLIAIELQRSQGRARAANLAIARANGGWIAFLDDDDEWIPTHLQGLMEATATTGAKVVYGGAELARARWDEGQGRFEVLERQVLSKPFSWPELLLGNYIPFNTLLINAGHLRKTGGVDETFDLYEDWDLLIRLARQEPFHHAPQVTARYHQWSEAQQINRQSLDEMRAATLRIFEKHRADVTPAVLMEYRESRDQEVQRLGKRLKSASQGLPTNACDELAVSWLEQLAESRDAHIHHLEALLEKEQRLHEAVSKQQQERLLHFDRLVRDRDEQAASLQALNAEIAAIRASLGWRTLQRLRELRSRWLPHGSQRGRVTNLGLQGLSACSQDGFGPKLKHASSRGVKAIRQIPPLCSKTMRFAQQHGVAATMRRIHQRLVHKPAASTPAPDVPGVVDPRYAHWCAARPTLDDTARQNLLESLQRRPTISILTPVYDVDPQWLERCIESVRRQSYPHWQLCLHDDASTREDTRGALRRWENVDPRILIGWSKHNSGISAASNAALARADGDFVALLDNDDELAPDALLEVALLLDQDPGTDLVYSDEDRITLQDDGNTLRHDPFFKPDWSPQLLFACMYTGHLSVYRRALIEELGGFRTAYDFSQDYDLALRITERSDRIRHLPKVLYHWRALPSSAAGGGKDFARRSNIAALQDACNRRGYSAVAEALPFANRVHFRAFTDAANRPLVSIVIPTDNRANLFDCIERIERHTDYRSYEIVVVTNSRLGADLLRENVNKPHIRLCAYDKPFNFSAKCNDGAAAAQGEYLLFFNDDVQALHGSWLEDMLGVFGRGGVGGVSPKLIYENDTIQYAGMVTGVRGLVGTAFHTSPKDSAIHFNFAQSERDVSLLSGACLLMPRKVFDEVGGWDAKRTPIMHSDVDLSCRIRERGYAMVYTPFAVLRHIGHLSLKSSDHLQERRKDKADTYLLKRWGHYLARDPWYPENMRAYLYHAGHVPYRMALVRQDDSMLDARDLLLVSHDLSLSGAPIMLLQLAERFRAQGHFVTVMSPQDGELASSYQALDIPVIIDATLSGEPDSQTAKLMAAFDLILANTIVAWPSVQVAHDSGTPVLWLLHESSAGQRMAHQNETIRRALIEADDVIFACAATRSLYAEFSNGSNYRTIPYGTQAPVVPPDLAPKGARTTFVHIGSIEPRKGQDLLLQALQRLDKSATEEMDFILIGRVLDVDYEDRIRPLLAATASARYLGALAHNEVIRALATADALICSSRDEVFPVTIMEAMALGKPVIATNVGGVSEMIRDGIDGLVVAPEDVQALATAITRMASDASDRERMGQAARQRFVETLTIERMAERLLDLIDSRLQAAHH